MKTCEYDGTPFTEPRSHPWTDSSASAEHRYYDFKAEPARIRTSLEDLVPWSHYPAIEQLYALLERLNAPASTLESNDCELTGPHPSERAPFPHASPERAALECSGRVMILFRALERNLSRRGVDALKDTLHQRLGPIDPGLELGMIGTTIVPVRFVTLPRSPLGHQLMISFWAWGSSEVELMGELDRVVRNLSAGLRSS